METFERLITAVMIGFPAVLATAWPVKSSSGDDSARMQAISRLKRRLWLGTAAALAVFLLLHVGLELAMAYYLWMAFFPLWFALAMPLLAAKDPGWQPVQQGPVRTATLERRDVLPSSLQRAWMGAGLLWGLVFAATVFGVLREGGSWWMLFFSVMAGIELGFFHWAMRRSMVEPEHRASGESPEVARARESLRNLKLWGWLGIATLAMIAFSLPPLVLSWIGDEALNLAIGLGVGGGVLAGIGGSVFGVMADVYRTRINREVNRQRVGESGTWAS
ncbi:MAG TPA: hypothetical protein VLK65_26355 [Vicinamibacteria bacterium]|nr:hypothetical protein [Vicinamibacteria bacterium]